MMVNVAICLALGFTLNNYEMYYGARDLNEHVTPKQWLCSFPMSLAIALPRVCGSVYHRTVTETKICCSEM